MYFFTAVIVCAIFIVLVSLLDRLEAGVFEESFDEKLMYDDNMIIELIDAACDVLGKCFAVTSFYEWHHFDKKSHQTLFVEGKVIFTKLCDVV